MLTLLSYAAQLQRDEAETRMPSRMSNVDLKAIAAEAGRSEIIHTKACALSLLQDADHTDGKQVQALLRKQVGESWRYAADGWFGEILPQGELLRNRICSLFL
jgi:hypothetical protein